MRRLLKWGCIGSVGLVVLLVILAVATGGGNGSTTTSQVSGPASVDADATPRPIAPAYAEMEADLDGKTDAQRNAYLRDLKGQRVEGWAGEVCNVTETFGSYYVEVSVDQEDDTLGCTNEIRWRVSEEQALEYNAGDTVTASGVIDDITNVGSAFSFRLVEVEAGR